MPNQRTSHQNDMAYNPQDHDLLIELRTEMKAVRSDIQKLTDNVGNRVTKLEDEVVTKTDHEDHETRIRRLEWWVAIGLGGLAIIEVIIQFLPEILKTKQ